MTAIIFILALLAALPIICALATREDDDEKTHSGLLEE